MSSDGHVQISDYSDREILAMIQDLTGPVLPTDLADRIFGRGPLPDPLDSETYERYKRENRCVVSRLVWMRRFGLIEETGNGWEATAAGKSMLGFELSRPVEVGLARISDTGGLVLANRIGEKLVKAGEITGTAMRRELQFQINRRKRR